MDEMEICRRIQQLEQEVSRLRARDEIENLVARYQHYRTAYQAERILKECWSDREDVTAEIGPSGVFVGLEHLGNYYQKKALPGRLEVRLMTTPDIEIFDAETAKGLWICIGTDTDAGELGEAEMESEESRALLTSRDENGKAYRAEWVFQKFEADFVREKGGWKICRLHIYELFRCPFDMDWVKFSKLRMETDGLRCDAIFTPEIEPDLPEGFPREYNPQFASTCHWQYTTSAPPVLMPEPPMPRRETQDVG